jgi:FkbM family methyltransferase
MTGFRMRFFSERIRSGEYRRKLSEVLANPSRFYSILISKLWPGLSTKAVDLKLKDGKIIRVREFWTLFLFDEIFVERCYEAPEILKHGPFDTVIDIGANIGLFTMRTKQLWPNARILAIEPHPDNYRYLQEHVQINQLRDVKALQVGVAERCGSLELYLSPRNIAGHSLYTKTEHSISIPTRTFSDILTEFGPDQKCGLLKIDCEGCEYALLSSFTQEIADRISCIVFEPTHSLYDVNQLNEKLALFGFKISKFGNLVVAAKP